MRIDTQPTILVVDDTPANIKLLAAVLGERGYRIVTAGSGAEALRQVAAASPNLVLLDIMMPGMDGYEVCRRLRDSPATQALPVVMITAGGDQEKVRAIEAGADDFIAKPLNQPELLARVRSLLRIEAYHDTIQRQAADLAVLNQTLAAQVAERTLELEEAREQVLELYAELAARNQHLHELVGQLLPRPTTLPRPGHDDTGDEPSGMEQLTPREEEVLERVAQGQTNAEIARDLVVSPGTIKTHVEHIIAKMHVGSRTEAAVRAVEFGRFGPARTRARSSPGLT